MAISRDTLNRETNARFWAQSGHKPGQRLDPNNPTDKAMMPIWMDIQRKVQAEADAGTLVTTFDHPEVAQNLADAEVANKVAAVHVDAAAQESDPALAQQHTEAAATAAQVFLQKLKEAAAQQPPTMAPQLQNGQAQNGQFLRPEDDPWNPSRVPNPSAPSTREQPQPNGQFLRPEDDPWNSRFVPKSQREQPSAPPSRSPRERPPAQASRPPRGILFGEVNARFWNRTRYKQGQKLDMTNPQDREMSKVWMEILREVEREANEGRLTLTRPESTPPQPSPRPQPSPQPQFPPQPDPRSPFPPQRPWGTQPMQPGLPGMPMNFGLPQPGIWPGTMQQPPMQQPPMQQPPMQQQPMQQQPMEHQQQPMQQQQQQRPMQQPTRQQQPLPMEGGLPSSSTEAAPSTPSTPPSEGRPPPITTEEGMSTKAKIAVAALGLAGLASLVYAVTRKSSPPSRPRARASVRMPSPIPPSSPFPPARGGRF